MLINLLPAFYSEPSYRTPTEIRRDQMMARYRDGVRVAEIAAEFGVKPHTVYETAFRFGVPRGGAIAVAARRDRRAAAAATKAERKAIREARRDQRTKEIVQKYESGARGDALAEEYGVSRERICQILRPTNVMATAHERNRLAREALAGEVSQIKAEAKAALAEKFDMAVGMIRSGTSISSAVSQAGLPVGQVNILSRKCRELGIGLMHGRHRDFSRRHGVVSEMLAAGHSKTDIVQYCRSQGDPVSLMWINRHFPSHVRSIVRQPSTLAGAPPPPSVASLHDPEWEWTEERTARLRGLWLNGSTAQQISDTFGGACSRNSVIGKVNRMRLAGQLFVTEE